MFFHPSFTRHSNSNYDLWQSVASKRTTDEVGEGGDHWDGFFVFALDWKPCELD